MSQYDFGTIDPNTKSGTALASDLNLFRTALHTSHSGSTAPSYITTGMLWVDNTSANLKIKMYDGAQSIDVAIIDATNNVARVAVDSAATSYITATTAAQIKHVIAGVDTATIRSTGLQFNIAAPIISDSNNNELFSFTTVASAVNHIDIKNAATAANPVIAALGNDTNIGITLTPKGTGRTNIGQLALDGTTITTTAAQLNFVTGVTSAIQTQLDAKAPLLSPALTGTPIAPTAANLTNTTQLATTAFVLANVPLAGAMTLLGTLNTTSGTTQTLSGLTLTSYAALLITVDNVSHDAVGLNRHLRLGGQQISCSSGTETPTFNGPLFVSLASGVASSIVANGSTTPSFRTQSVGVTTASTSLSFTLDGTGNFDLGVIKVWGLK